MNFFQIDLYVIPKRTKNEFKYSEINHKKINASTKIRVRWLNSDSVKLQHKYLILWFSTKASNWKWTKCYICLSF